KRRWIAAIGDTNPVSVEVVSFAPPVLKMPSLAEYAGDASFESALRYRSIVTRFHANASDAREGIDIVDSDVAGLDSTAVDMNRDQCREGNSGPCFGWKAREGDRILDQAENLPLLR